MVPGSSPVRLLAKLPEPALSVVRLLDSVGPAVLLQHTPLAVMAAPPSVLMVPPEVAAVVVMLVTAVVLMTGSTA